MYVYEQQSIRGRAMGAAIGNVNAQQAIKPQDAEQSQSEVGAACSSLECSITRLDNAVAALGGRLAPVIRPVPVAGCKEEASAAGLSTLAMSIWQQTERIDLLRHQIEATLDALAI